MKEPIKTTPYKPVSLDTSFLGNQIMFEEALKTSSRIYSPSIAVGGEDQILKEGYEDTYLIDQGLTPQEWSFVHHTLEFGSVVKQLADIENKSGLLVSSEPSKHAEQVEKPEQSKQPSSPREE